MEVEIFKEKLNQALTIIEHLIRKNINLPVLNNVLLEGEKNFLKLTATNLESTIIWQILTKIKKEGKNLVPVSFFCSLIGFLKEEKIKLKVQNNNLILEGKNQITQIQGVSPEEFPIIPKINFEDFLQIEGGEIKEGLSQIINIPSFSQTRPEISGIYFSFKKDKIKIVATDSFRLAEKTIELPEKIKKDFSFILPQTAGRDLLNILTIKPGKVKVCFSPNQVQFEWEGEETSYPNIRFFSRLVEGEYPNYQEIIPKKYTAEILLNKEEFQLQIKKAGLFSGKISEVKLTIFPQENKIKIFSESVQVGKNEAYLPAKIEAKTDKNLEISFNYKFLIAGLQNIKSPEVWFGLSDKEGPACLKSPLDENYFYILMPIKTS